MKLFGGRGAVVAALVLGALTSYLAWRYVDQATQAGQKVDMAPVVVATAPIPARTVIAPDMVRVQPMPVEAVHPQATHSVDEVVGKVVRTEMATDEPVLTSKLFLQRAESGLAFMVPDGMRAVSVGFTEVIGTGGMITPGDHVDVIGVFETHGQVAGPQAVAGQSGSGQPAQVTLDRGAGDQQTSLATMVLQDVPVLAVAQRLEGEDVKPKDQGQGLTMPGASSAPSGQQQMAQRAEPAPQPQAKTATLAVGPEDALKVVLAEEKGKIRLALRRANDKNMPSVGQVPLNALLLPAPDTTTARAATPAR
jgi:pilus assembly protein CpaB